MSRRRRRCCRAPIGPTTPRARLPPKEKSYALTEEQLHIQKSATALGNEVVAYLDRVG